MIWRLGQANIIVAVTVVAANDVVPVRLGVSSSVFLSCLRRDGSRHSRGCRRLFRKPPSGTLTLTLSASLAQLEARG